MNKVIFSANLIQEDKIKRCMSFLSLDTQTTYYLASLNYHSFFIIDTALYRFIIILTKSPLCHIFAFSIICLPNHRLLQSDYDIISTSILKCIACLQLNNSSISWGNEIFCKNNQMYCFYDFYVLLEILSLCFRLFHCE